MGLKKLLEYQGNVAEDIGYTFQVPYENSFGEVEQHELRPGGKDIPVTNENRQGTPSST